MLINHISPLIRSVFATLFLSSSLACFAQAPAMLVNVARKVCVDTKANRIAVIEAVKKLGPVDFDTENRGNTTRIGFQINENELVVSVVDGDLCAVVMNYKMKFADVQDLIEKEFHVQNPQINLDQSGNSFIYVIPSNSIETGGKLMLVEINGPGTASLTFFPNGSTILKSNADRH